MKSAQPFLTWLFAERRPQHHYKSGNNVVRHQQCVHLLKKNGLVVIVIYSGHEGGSEERDAVMITPFNCRKPNLMC
nr:class I SAM-dependent methyltransferase [Planococcus salinarum]